MTKIKNFLKHSLAIMVVFAFAAGMAFSAHAENIQDENDSVSSSISQELPLQSESVDIPEASAPNDQNSEADTSSEEPLPINEENESSSTIEEPIETQVLPNAYLGSEDFVMGETTYEQLFPDINLAQVMAAKNSCSTDNPVTLEAIQSITILTDLKNLSIENIEGLQVFTNLIELDLSNNGISSLPENFGMQMSSLKKLNLSSNQLSNIPDDFGIGMPRLEVLRLEKNQIVSLPNNFGQGLDRLVNLALYNNKLTSLPVNFEYGFSKVEFLLLQDNLFSSLPENFGSGMVRLKSLQLYNNQITYLPENFCQGMGSLESLGLSNNKLTSLPENFGRGMNGLANLELSNNQLTNLPEKFGQGIEGLRWLILNDNQLTSLPEYFGTDMSELYWLFLNDNRLTKLPENFGKDMSTLYRLSLKNNQLTSLPEYFGQGLNNLYYLLLQNNQLAGLPESFGQGMDTLTELYLMNNHLISLPENFGDGMSGSLLLRLDNNRLNRLPENFEDKMAFFSKVNFDNNQITDLPAVIYNASDYASYGEQKYIEKFPEGFIKQDYIISGIPLLGQFVNYLPVPDSFVFLVQPNGITKILQDSNYSIESNGQITLDKSLLNLPGEYELLWKVNLKQPMNKVSVYKFQFELKQQKFELFFDSNGGSSVPTQIVIEGEKGKLPLPPTRKGYTFNGWYTARDGGIVFNSQTTIVSSMTVFAHWIPNFYQLKFLPNGGTGTPTTQSLTMGQKATEPVPVPVRDGYILIGWNTQADGNGTNWNLTLNTIPAEDITLFAQWHLESNSGSNSGTNSSSNGGTSSNNNGGNSSSGNGSIGSNTVSDGTNTGNNGVGSPILDTNSQSGSQVGAVSSSVVRPVTPPANIPVARTTEVGANQTVSSASQNEDQETNPDTIISDLDDINSPLGRFSSAQGNWSIVNVLVCLIGLMVAIWLIALFVGQKLRRFKIFAVLAIITSVINAVIIVIFSNFSGALTFVDGLTPVMLLLFSLQIIFSALGKRRIIVE